MCSLSCNQVVADVIEDLSLIMEQTDLNQLKEARYTADEIDLLMEGATLLPENEEKGIEANEVDSDGDEEFIEDMQVSLAKKATKRKFLEKIIKNKLENAVYDNDGGASFKGKVISLE
ncbi:hypothetical protein L1887_25544 [Cichorium endivia]|nr:hypothetical protein L1887_25544 [Cichorium endivia]